MVFPGRFCFAWGWYNTDLQFVLGLMPLRFWHGCWFWVLVDGVVGCFCGMNCVFLLVRVFGLVAIFGFWVWWICGLALGLTILHDYGSGARGLGFWVVFGASCVVLFRGGWYNVGFADCFWDFVYCWFWCDLAMLVGFLVMLGGFSVGGVVVSGGWVDFWFSWVFGFGLCGLCDFVLLSVVGEFGLGGLRGWDRFVLRVVFLRCGW